MSTPYDKIELLTTKRLPNRNKYHIIIVTDLCIIFENALDNANVKIHNNTIQTTKQDKSNHEFSLYSMQKAIDKCDGNLTFSCKDKVKLPSL